MHVNGLWKLAVPIAAVAVAAMGCGDGGDDNGDTLSASPTGTVLGANAGPEGADSPAEGSCTPQTYEVQSGDTLSQIALTFDVDVQAIAGASGITDPNQLTVGQELTIPCPGQLPSTPDPSNEAAESPTPAS